jgi:outer membrane protein assembly factor BamA
VADRPALGCEVAPQDDGFDVSTEVKLTYDKRANWYGITTGNLVGLSYERGLPDLGSDFDYWIGYLRLVHARKFWAEHNLVLRGSATYGSNLPFQQELTSGGTNLRGYRNMQFRGDTRVWGSFEYSVPFFKIGPLAFRGLAFADMAYTTFLSDEAVNSQRHYLRDQTEVDSGQFRLGVGAGFRIYVRSIVMPLLGVDVGYGPQADSNYVYFAVGLTEL